MSKHPEEVKLSKTRGEQLIGRIRSSDLSGDDQQLLAESVSTDHRA